MELREIQSKLNIEEFRNKPPLAKKPISREKEKPLQKSPIQSKKANNTSYNNSIKKERSHSSNSANTFKPPSKSGRMQAGHGQLKSQKAILDDKNIDIDAMTYEVIYFNIFCIKSTKKKDILALEDKIGYVSKGLGSGGMAFIPDFAFSEKEFPQEKDRK